MDILRDTTLTREVSSQLYTDTQSARVCVTRHFVDNLWVKSFLSAASYRRQVLGRIPESAVGVNYIDGDDGADFQTESLAKTAVLLCR